ncbi:ABC transporter permease [Xanthobacter sp. YC-JY1]|uniref:ABC transporter permease n=1 Tax=Xanthobacter sp. YC-JY1 TaxID=2419844 RepID=UPI001F02E610|nr:ABC transporter permease [Xanthobacter sp. YC-JY1]UJX45051.1 hypothetical protein D7006_10160 [Xanthobacter sp. YC-JY1]
MQRPRSAPGNTHGHARGHPGETRTRHAAETWADASAMHARVVGAVIMRDLQTRFGTGYFGFLLGLLIPLAHLTIAIVVTAILGRPAAIGTDVPIFLMTGVLPFVVWLYGHRQIMQTLSQNRSLLYFPGVDLFDLFASRIILEIVTATLVVFIVLGTLAAIGHQPAVANWQGFLLALIQAWLFGVGTGLIFGALGPLLPIAYLFGNILGPLLWGISGIFFLPDAIPERLANILMYNPLCQIIDTLRMSYYSEYYSSFFNQILLNSMILGIVTLGMVIMAAARKIV